MNRKNIRRLAKFIEGERYEFNMVLAHAAPSCGSAGCIGAHAATLWPSIRDEINAERFSWHDDGLAKKLGITPEKVRELCYPPGLVTRCDRRMAVGALRRLARTGKVEFRIEEYRGSIE